MTDETTTGVQPVDPTDPANDPPAKDPNADPVTEFAPFLTPPVRVEHLDNPDTAMRVSSAPGMGFIPAVAPPASEPEPMPVEVVHAPATGELGSDIETLADDAKSAGEKLGTDLMTLERDLSNAGLSIIDVIKHTAKSAFGINL